MLYSWSPGKYLLYNIVAFAKESVRSHVTTLRPENFPHNEKEPWLVDFFVPVSVYPAGWVLVGFMLDYTTFCGVSAE